MRIRPSVYLDTNIFSTMFYRGRNPATIACRNTTREWWNVERTSFTIVSSAYTEIELTGGKFHGQDRALALIKRQHYLVRNKEAELLALKYINEKLVPETKLGDAVQLALATAHGIDYLLTWNYAHLANVETQRRLMDVNARLSLRSPLLVSPDTIPKSALGQSIRRKDK